MADQAGSRLGAALFLAIGLLALTVAAWQGWQTARFLRRAVAATGKVVTAPGEPRTGVASAHPSIEFAGPDGRPVRYRQNGMGARPVGLAVPLLYDPARPAETAVARGFWTLWFPVAGPLLLGLAFLAVPLSGIAVTGHTGRF